MKIKDTMTDKFLKEAEDKIARGEVSNPFDKESRSIINRSTLFIPQRELISTRDASIVLSPESCTITGANLQIWFGLEYGKALADGIVRQPVPPEHRELKYWLPPWKPQPVTIQKDNAIEPIVEGKIILRLPKTGKLISTFAKELADILENKNVLFYRTDAKEIVEIGKLKNEKEQTFTGFSLLKPPRFITLAENYVLPGLDIWDDKSRQVMFMYKSMTADLANIILQSAILQDALPKIDRLFTFPLPIILDNKLTFPVRGYDARFSSWLPKNTPELKTDMSLEEAKATIDFILKEFPFQTEQYKTKAIAGMITPFLRGLYSKFNNRTPLFLYLGNRERVGKDYLAGINGLIYECAALEEPPICNSEKGDSSNDELRKKIMAAFLVGRKRLHFSNNKGYINNAVFEQVITSEVWSDRLLGKNDAVIFNNELELSLSGNLGIGFTPDLAARSISIRLFLEIEDANAKRFDNPTLHKWVLDNRPKVLSALYALVRTWVEKGCQNGKIPFASFSEWARVCGGVMEAAGYDSPCKPDEESLIIGGDSETANMKHLFEVCHERFNDTPVSKKEIVELAQEEEIFPYLDFDRRPDQTKFGVKLQKYIGRVLSNIRMASADAFHTRTSRMRYVFVKVIRTDGNLGNSSNYLPPLQINDLMNINRVGHDTKVATVTNEAEKISIDSAKIPEFSGNIYKDAKNFGEPTENFKDSEKSTNLSETSEKSEKFVEIPGNEGNIYTNIGETEKPDELPEKDTKKVPWLSDSIKPAEISKKDKEMLETFGDPSEEAEFERKMKERLQRESDEL